MEKKIYKSEDESSDCFFTPRTSLEGEPEDVTRLSAASSGRQSSEQPPRQVASVDPSAQQDSDEECEDDVFDFKTPTASCVLDKPDFVGKLPHFNRGLEWRLYTVSAQSDPNSHDFATPPETPQEEKGQDAGPSSTALPGVSSRLRQRHKADDAWTPKIVAVLRNPTATPAKRQNAPSPTGAPPKATNETKIMSIGRGRSICKRSARDPTPNTDNPLSSTAPLVDAVNGMDATPSDRSSDRLHEPAGSDFLSSDSEGLRSTDRRSLMPDANSPPSSPTPPLEYAEGSDLSSSRQSILSSVHLHLAEYSDLVSIDSNELSPRLTKPSDASETRAPSFPAGRDLGREGIVQDRSRVPRKNKQKREDTLTSSSTNNSIANGRHRHKVLGWLNRFFKPKRVHTDCYSDSDYRVSSSSGCSLSSNFTYPDEPSSGSEHGHDVDVHDSMFVNADTLRPSPLFHGVHVHSTLVLPQGAASYDDMTADEILQRLSSGPVTPLHTELKLTLLSKTLPRAEKRQDLAGVSLCLKSPCQRVCHSAGLTLERMLMGEIAPQKSSDAMMLVVLETVWGILEGSRHDQKNAVSQHSQLLLLATCVLLCRHDLSHHTSSMQENLEKLQQGFFKGSELNPASRDYLLLKGLKHFFKDIHGTPTSRLSYHEADWERHLQAPTSDWRTNMDHKLRRANFAQLIQVTFSLCKEVMKKATDSYVWLLTKEIGKLLKAVTKRKLSEHLSVTFHFFLVRCLRLIITTNFKEDQQEIGEEEPCMSAGKIAKLLVSAVKNAPVRHQPMLQDEIRQLSFHKSNQVRKEMKEFARDSLAMVELSLSYAEDRLHVAGLRPQRASPNENVGSRSFMQSPDKKPSACAWQEHDWRGEDRQLLQGAMCHPTQRCLASAAADDCVQHSEPQHRSRQYQKHLEMLLRLGDHDNFLRLLAFQFSPRPCFYVTESVSKRLTSLLIDARKIKRWLRSAVLLGAAKQIAKALEFLAIKGIALRNLTTFNMVCLPQADKHDEVKNVRVKLADLGLADDFVHSSKSACYENRNVRKLRDPGPIPVRWTSWEALFEGSFSAASMVFAFGFVLYELFTHGCWPYTEMGAKSIEDILQAFFRKSQSVSVFQWPCLPDDVYKLIRQCTEMQPENRPSIKSLEQRIQALLDQERFQAVGAETGDILKGKRSKNASYPPISLEQLNRKHAPEEEIPMIIHQLVKGDPGGYKNLRQSSWSSTAVTAATDAELIPVDQCAIECQGVYTTVQEQFTKEYVRHVLPDVESIELPGIAEWTAPPTISATEGIHGRQYKSAMTLLQAAIRLGPDRSDDWVETTTLLHMLHQLASTVKGLHAQDWLLCDLRASYVLLARDNCKVIIVRIGRMLKLPEGMPSVRCTANYADSTRWCAPEVLHNHVVCKASDVFMLGTVIWEVFNARLKCRDDPTAESSPARLVPFPDHKSSEVPDMVQEGVLLPSVLLEKKFEWVNLLIYDCRNPDCDRRPTIDEVVERMKVYCATPVERISYMFRKSASLSATSSSSEPPVPPKRGRFKIVKSFRRTFGILTGNKSTRVLPGKEEFYKLGYRGPPTDENYDVLSSSSQRELPVPDKPASAQPRSQSKLPSNVDDLSSTYLDPEKDLRITKGPPARPPKDAISAPTFPSEVGAVNRNKERLPPRPTKVRVSSPGQSESSQPKLKPAARCLSQRLPMPLPDAAPWPEVSSFGDRVCPDPRKPLVLTVPLKGRHGGPVNSDTRENSTAVLQQQKAEEPEEVYEVLDDPAEPVLQQREAEEPEEVYEVLDDPAEPVLQQREAEEPEEVYEDLDDPAEPVLQQREEEEPDVVYEVVDGPAEPDEVNRGVQRTPGLVPHQGGGGKQKVRRGSSRTFFRKAQGCEGEVPVDGCVDTHYQNVPPDRRISFMPALVGCDGASRAPEQTHYQNVQRMENVSVDESATAIGVCDYAMTGMRVPIPTETEDSDENKNDDYLTPIYEP